MPQSRPSTPRNGQFETSSEDFLYHLYRGSELLADGRYDGAREELDRALRAQPRDLAAQDMLAKVYFKLGVYPRAIELYQDIVQQFPDRMAPRINLALAFLKTGQMRDVVSQLLPVIEREPAHGRAWGYLGLAWSRLGEYAKAREAFTRAGHDGMARRMEELLESQYGPAAKLAPRGEPNELLRPSMLPADFLEPTESPATLAIPRLSEPHVTGEPVGSAPQDPGEGIAPEPGSTAWLVRERSIAPRGELLEMDHGAVVAVDGCAARLGPRCIEVGLVRGEAVARTTRGGVFSGTPPLVWLRSGWAITPPRPGRERLVVSLANDALVLREERVLAFDGALLFENLKDVAGIDAVRFEGRGRVVLETSATVRAVAVLDTHPCVVPTEALVGWRGALTVETMEDGTRIAVRGDGHVLVSGW